MSRNDSRPGRADDVARARMRWRILATISAASYSEAAQYWYSLCESSSASRKMQRNCRRDGGARGVKRAEAGAAPPCREPHTSFGVSPIVTWSMSRIRWKGCFVPSVVERSPTWRRPQSRSDDAASFLATAPASASKRPSSPCVFSRAML